MIFNCGWELFHSKGFKDTNISEIAKMAGIAVGTFYNYYPSKERLFFEIYMKENEKFKKRMIESLDMNQDPVTLVKQIVEQNISATNTSNILKEWYNHDLFRELEQYYEEVKAEDDSIRSLYTGLFKKWKAEGKIRDDIDDELLPAFLDSLAYIDAHKEEIGLSHFPQLIQYLAEFIMKGLTETSR
ncbi:transcriptional regulator, TetR family [Paenibacillus alvei DSM 29]|uniref:TetR/AcrR family transcriptional regulator n=2 Tax=Paenibacillus TaxID=44249 RepID=UPI000287DBB4|nr:TetR/AcrR family transcriptional regulator [Paenibacillus alvei]EJW15920.1 transcriptional regulator, TetR family [Paenibacillus alvei DSM 29]